MVIKWMVNWAGHVACMGDTRNICKILVRKPGGKRPLRRSMHKWKENIEMNVMEIGWEVLDCVHLAQDRDHYQAVVNTSS
jgi:hypothetical protein